MSNKYTPGEIEQKWQSTWKSEDLFHTAETTDKPKFYYLDMFPYPSGNLHMGHVRNYIIGDVISRYQVMQGYNVLHPMGWDAFGLPAENAAIQRQIHPNEWTQECITQMKRQFDRLGISYDWSREINASQPDYYKWTQWLFLQLYKAGLAYRGEATVNWCPSCATVLANEELDGVECERCGSQVEVRQSEGQWFFDIRKYADRLLDDLQLLDRWPERVRVMQEHWIGRSEGVSFRMKIADREEEIEVFTTRIDTIYGVTYVVLAPEHPLVRKLTAGTEYEGPVRDFVTEALRKGEIDRAAADVEKKGIYTGVDAIHPLTGEKVPIWIADYVLMGYGTGAIMAVPTHDQRDFEFAHRYDLPLRVVIEPKDTPLDAATMTGAYEEDGVQVNSGPFDGLDNNAAKEAIADHLEAEGIGRRTINFRLRDWLVSRQRYWGAPIPIIHCNECGAVPVPEEDLPVMLPTDAEFKPTGESPLARHEGFVHTTCPTCGGAARRETDTMTTYVCSSWYFLRYTTPTDDSRIFDRKKVDYWLPVDKYVGGVEHAVRHLLYARFITKVLHDLGHLSFEEPFTELFTQGMICSRTPEGRLEKMSKSKGNAVPADDIVEKYGADTARTFVLFVGPPDKDAEWQDKGVEGCHRFLGRVWRLASENLGIYREDRRQALSGDLPENCRSLRRKTHQTIRRVADDIENMGLNTLISAIMELTNEALQFAAELKADDDAACATLSEAMECLVVLLSPAAPHLCCELWEKLGKTDLYHAAWPAFDPELAAEEMVTVVIQVNGKVRGRLEVRAGTDMQAVQEAALLEEAVQRHVAGKEIVKTIPVPDKLLNIVVK